MTPSPSRRAQIQPVFAVALGVVAIAIVAGAVLASRPTAAAGPTATLSPSIPPSTSAVATPVPTPPAVPTPEPTAPSSSENVTIELLNATGHDLVLQVHDQTGTLAGAESGPPRDGMSVRWHDATVRSVGPRTLLVTWAGLPQDETVDLGIASIDGMLQVTIIQAGPLPYSDAMGEDRAVALTFDGPIAADGIGVVVLDRTVD